MNTSHCKHQQRIKAQNEISVSLSRTTLGSFPSKEITTVKFRIYVFTFFSIYLDFLKPQLNYTIHIVVPYAFLNIIICIVYLSMSLHTDLSKFLAVTESI